MSDLVDRAQRDLDYHIRCSPDGSKNLWPYPFQLMAELIAAVKQTKPVIFDD